MKKVEFSAHSISFTDLVSVWVETYHEEDYTIIIFDPSNHLDFLKKLNLGHSSLRNLYESKVLSVSFKKMEDAQFVFSTTKFTEGPYAQLYFKGKYITDNIEG